MTQEHLITPPPELLAQWEDEILKHYQNVDVQLLNAYQAGADAELEACCAIALVDPVCGTKHQRRMLVNHIRGQRRPKAPSLKEKLKEAIYNENLGDALRLVEQLDDSL